MTPKEISWIIDGYNQREKEELKANLIRDYRLAENIAGFVSLNLNGKNAPKIEEVYPRLFKDDAQPTTQLALEIQKEKLIDFAVNHNKQRRGDKIK